YVDFEVVSINDNIEVYINSDLYEDDLIQLSKNKEGCYEIVLANPSYDLGLTEVNDYLYSRNLYFLMNYGGDNDTNYIVQTNLISDSNNSSITISDISSTMSNQYMGVFCIQSVKEGGTIVHTFNIEHRSFVGVFTQEVKVMIIVKNFTRNISIDSSTKGEDGIIYVYDTYSTGVLGSSINVTLNPYYEGQKYYICFPSAYMTSLSLVRSSGKPINMAQYDPITSIFDITDATACSVGATVYLKHKYIIVPNVDTVTMYVLTYFDLASSDYAEVKEDFFNIYPIMQSIDIKIVKGMTDISIESNNYTLDVTNEAYVDPGIRLLELPQGNSFENTIESIEYSNELEVCHVDLLYENAICSLMLKVNDEYREGSVNITITTINGLSKTISVITFIPIVYPTTSSQDFDDRWQGAESTMPLNVEIDKEDEAYLGDMSLLYTEDGVTGDVIYDTATSSSTIIVDLKKLAFNGFGYEVEDWGYSYTTFTDLVLATNSSMDLNVFNYLLYKDENGRKLYNKINVNASVTASYSILNYISWEDGVLTTYSNKTTNKNTPVRMTLNYSGYVEYYDIDNGYYTEKIKVSHVINVWVYDIISTIDLLSSKNVTLYDSNSLGYYDSSSCSYTIDVEVNPEVEDLGGWVSESNALYGVNMLYNVTDKHIATIYNDNRTNRVEVMLSDLYKIEGNVITAQIGQRVLDFLDDPNVTQSLDEILSMIYRNKVSFSVNIYVTQFNKSTAINSILVTLDFAKMVEDIYLDIDNSEGLYFEVREDGMGNLQAYPSSLSVDFIVNPDIAYNGNVRLINYITSSYYVLEGNVIKNGTFTVVPKLSAGEYSIIVAAEDSFHTLGGDTYYFDTYKTLKVKVADGSKEYPFEIRSVQDFEQMLDDVNSGLSSY
ncbi:MAG: hypothetical protein IJW28_03615, partial [Clostridia bacterium]|nr:hypothetical protein [Clostridia bacterium]